MKQFIKLFEISRPYFKCPRTIFKLPGNKFSKLKRILIVLKVFSDDEVVCVNKLSREHFNYLLQASFIIDPKSSHIIALPPLAVLENVELAQVVLLGLVLQQAGDVAQLEAVLGEAVHLEEALAVVKLAEKRVFLAVASDARVGIISRILALAVKLGVALRQACEIIVQL